MGKVERADGGNDVREEREAWKRRTVEKSFVGYRKMIEKFKMKKKSRRSKYNRIYKWIRTEEIPSYIEADWSERSKKKLERFKLGKKIKEEWYWIEDKERGCKLCDNEEEMEVCVGGI